MKKLNLSLLILVMASFLFVGCKKSPEDVAVKFITHLSKCEFKKAAELGDKGTKAYITMLESMDDKEKEEFRQKNISIKVLETNIEDDTAEVKLSVTGDDGEPQTEEIELVKINGNWKIRSKK